MKSNISVFTCDECGARKEIEGVFPYQEGWVYLYNFDFKLSGNNQNKNHDKHLCSDKCFRKYIDKLIEEGKKRAIVNKIK